LLQHLSVDRIRFIAETARRAVEAQDSLLNKAKVVDKNDDYDLINEQTTATLDTLDASLENRPLAELRQLVSELSDDERMELMAVMWVGRGDFDPNSFDDAVQHARSVSDAGDVDMIAEKTRLPDFLAKGLYLLKLV
jgi:hypothetical protein